MSEPNPPSQPTTPGTPEPPAPPAGPPAPPVPRYGEYAPAGYVPPNQPAPGYEQQAAAAGQFPGAAQPGVRKRRTWDVVLTSILLVLGFFGMLAGLGYAALFSDPVLLDDAFRQQGLDGFGGEIGSAPTVLIASHVILYLIALGGAIPLLVTKRIAFWVPLSAGVLATIIFWTTVVGVMLSDPNVISTYS